MNSSVRVVELKYAERSGFSLIELMVVMSVSFVLLTLATGTIVRMQALSRSDTHRVESLATFVDVGRQFRQDVHQAKRATVSDGVLTLEMAGQPIRYQRIDDELSRQVGNGFSVRSPLLGYEPTWQRDGTVLRLILTPPDDAINPPRQFDAAIGLLTTVSDAPAGDGE
jgi:prepilin-type N-terminal cleavage/methylation domain-containing protein